MLTDHHGLKGRVGHRVVQAEGAIGAAVVLFVLGAGLLASPVAEWQGGRALPRVQHELGVVAQCPVASGRDIWGWMGLA